MKQRWRWKQSQSTNYYHLTSRLNFRKKGKKKDGKYFLYLLILSLCIYSLLQSREQYRDMTVYQLSTFSSLANRAAIIIHTALLMSHAHPLYYTSIEYALNVFRMYITQAGT